MQVYPTKENLGARAQWNAEIQTTHVTVEVNQVLIPRWP